MAEIVSKAEFSRRMGVSKARVSQYCAEGMPTLPDGKLDFAAAQTWVMANVADWATYEPGRRLPGPPRPRSETRTEVRTGTRCAVRGTHPAPSLAEARRRRELAQAQLAEIELARRK